MLATLIGGHGIVRDCLAGRVSSALHDANTEKVFKSPEKRTVPIAIGLDLVAGLLDVAVGHKPLVSGTIGPSRPFHIRPSPAASIVLPVGGPAVGETAALFNAVMLVVTVCTT